MRRWLLSLLLLPFGLMASPERIVAIGGDVTEIVVALGAGPALVARDSTSLRPARVQKLPDVGYLRQLNAEGILAMRPTLVLASQQAQPSYALKQVADSGVAVVTVPAANRLSVIEEKVQTIAAALNRKAQGEALRQRVREDIARLGGPPLSRPALYIMNHGAMAAMAAGRDTAADAALRAAGLPNALAGVRRYQPMTAEGIIASRPALVVIGKQSLDSLGGEAALWALPGLARTPAGQRQRLAVVDEMALLGFGIATPQALLALRQAAERQP